ncbi:hypothetical protein SDRG_06254 [Saprolegnia diclina VS20]|uniref:Glutaredoxin domain-containing protein n=1 Tax=Saprolegnia diclina (strain VS20) TaxID=1156394 RepID=T0RUK1_SAPDV|nr:hypothetical protein SDRG_06254 [Saprolegnia diclina VS20]EQC36138.1 hypothetical protein SDRG_06254 [Saprolegnia diclina VS20]|eukprot:XP_008610244.1 hypothetical protein SDRG_06254 [Saprolegnia diclina VS20]
MGNSNSSTPESKSFVENALATNGVSVFSKTYCPYCTKAKNVLNSVGVPFTVYELDTMPNGDAILQSLAEITGRHTVPNVFIKTKTIGGGDDVAQLHRDGKLVTLLKEAGVLQ